MARMHSRKKGKSGSKKPPVKEKKIWVRYTPKEVESLVIKIVKTGKSASQAGLILRDTYGIPNIKDVTNKSISAILKENKLLSDLPEDFIALAKRELKLIKHLESNKQDMTAKRGIQLTESKILRLTKYYKKVGRIPQNWTYDREKIKLLIS